MDVPAGFVRVERDGAVMVLREGLVDPLLAAGVADPSGVVARAPADSLRGRAPLGRVDLGGEGRAVVRALRRGGLLGKLVRRLSLDRRRAESELQVSARAAARGAAVLEVLGAVTRPATCGWHHGVVTREVEGARDLLAVLREAGGAERRRALGAGGEAVRRLHDAGVDHVDLNVKNVLVDPAGRALVLDLDRCRLAAEGPLPWAVRRRNLLRLLRSWVKLGAAEPGAVRPRDPLRFARGYAGGDRDLRRRVVAAGRGARFPLRRLLWRLAPPRAS